MTLYYGFIVDLLRCYENNATTFAKDLFEMAPKLPSDDPTQLVGMDTYNHMCQWIEDNLGAANLRRAGAAIGARAYEQMLATGALGSDPQPQDLMKGLVSAAATMIQDRRGRGWRIVRSTSSSITMRRTQTFNCLLQEGLLSSLVAKSGVNAADAQHVACVRDGAEFCDYSVTWLAGHSSERNDQPEVSIRATNPALRRGSVATRTASVRGYW